MYRQGKRMVVVVKGTDLAFFPVPKNACSSVKYALLNHNEDGLADRLPAVGPRGKTVRYVHQVYPTTRFGPLTPLRQARRRWFAVVRDPVRRFLSAYANRIVHHDDLKRCKPGALARAGLERHPDLERFVADLERYCAVSPITRHHVAPMVTYLGRRPERYDRLFAMSGLGQLPAYCAEAGAPVTLPHRQARGPKIDPAALSRAARDKLLQFYAEDYRYWGAHLDG